MAKSDTDALFLDWLDARIDKLEVVWRQGHAKRLPYENVLRAERTEAKFIRKHYLNILHESMRQNKTTRSWWQRFMAFIRARDEVQ